MNYRIPEASYTYCGRSKTCQSDIIGRFGAVPFDAENHDLRDLLKLACSKFYEEKRIKHAEK